MVLDGFWSNKTTDYWPLFSRAGRFIMENGAKGVEVIISGKLRAQRAKVRDFWVLRRGVFVQTVGFCRFLSFDGFSGGKCSWLITIVHDDNHFIDILGDEFAIWESPPLNDKYKENELKLHRFWLQAMKFRQGYLISTGEPKRHYISEAVRHVQMRQGTIGIKVAWFSHVFSLQASLSFRIPTVHIRSLARDV